MSQENLLAKLRQLGLTTPQAYYAQAFARNLGLLTLAEQHELAHAKVAIAGMGGVGGVHLITLVRTGIGKFHLADFDVFEPANVNRQFGARIPAFGRSKLDVMIEEALSINPFLEITAFPEGVQPDNIDAFLEGVQVVVDGLDFFSFEIRRALFMRARQKGVYVITAGPMGFSAAMLIFAPHEGMSFDEYFHIVEGMAPQEQYLAFALGLAPRPTHIKYMDLSKVDLETKVGPSLNIACQLCSAMAATEAVRIVLRRSGQKPVPYYFQFDAYLQKYRKGKLYLGNRNPMQRLKIPIVKMILRKKQVKVKTSPPELPQSQVLSTPIPEQVLTYIIRAGMRAPSGDNAQPWKFRLQENTILFYLDRDADCSFFNINQLASIISCGAVLENMRLAATVFGLQTLVTYLPSADNPDLMASVTFTPAGLEKALLFDAIWSRYTNRKMYLRQRLPESTLLELIECVATCPGVQLQILTEVAQLKKLASVIYQVERIRTEHQALHEHLHSMIRYSDKEAKEKGNGFALKNLEAGLSGEVFLRCTRSWRVMNIVNMVGLGRLVALHSSQAIMNASAVILLTVCGTQPVNFLQGGEALERLWLLLTHQGLAMQPMTAITLFWLRWCLEGEQGFLPKHRLVLQRVWQNYQSLFSNSSSAEEGQIMLFRVGYGGTVECQTYRKEIQAFIL